MPHKTCAAAIIGGLATLLVASSWDSATPSAQAPVTFSEHVAPIVFANCTTCHRPGEAAPFSLLSLPGCPSPRESDRRGDLVTRHAAVEGGHKRLTRVLDRGTRALPRQGNDVESHVARWHDEDAAVDR